jgi:hypothetical protein
MLNFDGIELDEEVQSKLNEQVSTLVSSTVEQEVGGLKGKVEELLSEKKAMQEKAEQEALAAQKAAEEAARKSGDVEAIDNSWNEKYSKLENEKNEALASANKLIHDLTVGQAATRLAAELGGNNADGLMPHILPRLDVDTKTGEVRVLDNKGQPSALTIDELKSELTETSYLAPLIVVSNAAGGGANGNKSAVRDSNQSMTADQKRAAEINKRLGKI